MRVRITDAIDGYDMGYATREFETYAEAAEFVEAYNGCHKRSFAKVEGHSVGCIANAEAKVWHDGLCADDASKEDIHALAIHFLDADEEDAWCYCH